MSPETGKKGGITMLGTSTNAKPLTINDVQNALQKINEFREKRPFPVIMFSKHINQGLKGVFVDEMLGCSEGEQGYMLPESARGEIEEENEKSPFRYLYREVKASDLPQIHQQKTMCEILNIWSAPYVPRVENV